MIERARAIATPVTLVALAVMCAVAVAQTLELALLPDGDSAHVAMRVRDATSSHPPLVGMPTTLAMDVIEANHLGPLEFYVLGAMDRIFLRSAWSLPVAAGIAVWLALATAVAAARSAWGPFASVLAGLAGAWLVWTTGSHTVTEILNFSPPIYGCFAGLVALAAALDGASRWLPAAVFWLSYAAHAHLSFGPIGIALGALAVVVAVLPVVDLSPRWRWATVGVAALCWLPVLLDQLTATDGNLSALWRASTSSAATPAGMDFGSNVAGQVLGLPPPVGARPFEQSLMVLGHGNGKALLLVLPVGVAVAVVVLARRRATPYLGLLVVAAAGVTAVITCARASLVLGGVPPQYVRVLWATGLAFWLVAAITAMRLRPWPSSVRTAGWWAVAAALVVAVPVAGGSRRDLDGDDIAARNHIVDDAVAALVEHPDIDAGRPVRLSTAGYTATNAIAPTLVAELERRGVAVRVEDGPHVARRSYRQFRVEDEDAGAGPRADEAVDVYVGLPDDAPIGAKTIAQFGGLDEQQKEELETLDEEVLDALEDGRGTRLTAFGQIFFDGHLEPEDADDVIRNHSYADLLAGRLVVDPPIPADAIERYVDLARRLRPDWQTVVTVGGRPVPAPASADQTEAAGRHTGGDRS